MSKEASRAPEDTYLPTYLESRNKIFAARSKSYILLSTLLTIIPCYTGHVYTPKAFDAP